MNKNVSCANKTIWIIIPLIFALSHFRANGQSPCFSVSSQRGCAQLSVTVSDCSGSSAIFYDYGEGNGYQSGIFTNTYENAGKYKLIQLVQSGTGSDTVSKIIEVLPTPDPIFEFSLCEDTSVNIIITDNNYEEYFIEFSDGYKDTLLNGETINHPILTISSAFVQITGNYNPGNCGGTTTYNFTPIGTLSKPNITEIIQYAFDSVLLIFDAQKDVKYELLTSKNDTLSFVKIDSLVAGSTTDTFLIRGISASQSCFKLRAYDYCGNELFSENICLVVPSVVSKTDYNEISWSKYAANGFQKFELYRDSVLLKTFAQNNAQVLSDSDIFCGLKYCYSLKSYFSGGKASSADSCVLGFSSQAKDSIVLQTSYNLSNTIDVRWNNPFAPVKLYTLKADGNTELTTTDTFEIVTKKAQCFTLDYTNYCDNKVINDFASCPIVLSGNLDAVNADILHLSWSSYKGKDSLTTFSIEFMDEAGNLLEDYSAVGNSISMNVNYSFNIQNAYYRIKGSNSSFVTYSNIIQIELMNKIFAPNAFSPNNDGLNDQFRVIAKYAENINLRIFDRWNNLVYSTTEVQHGWNGTLTNGKEAPAGIYAFYAEITDQNGNIYTRQGTLTLIR